jgi:hypothetical protein
MVFCSSFWNVGLLKMPLLPLPPLLLLLLLS